MTHVLIDMTECAVRMVSMMGAATKSIYYSAFVCHLDHALPGHPDITMRALVTHAVNRGVHVHMLLNNSTQYGNTPLDELGLDPRVHVRGVSGDGDIPFPFNQLFGQTYTNHHQKYLMIDDSFVLVGGVGVDPSRQGWLIPNTQQPESYYWHEVGVLTPCTTAMTAWLKAQWEGDFRLPPSPFVAGVTEHLTTLRLIDEAKTCIHMEAQLCISTDSTENQVLGGAMKRVARAFHTPNDPFRFIFLVNNQQPDEHMFISAVALAALNWSVQAMIRCAETMGVPVSFLHERVCVGILEHNNTHIKVHSNIVIQDGHTMLRSSSNLTDRSLNNTPCDNELGVVVMGDAVSVAQQRLWQRYFMLPDDMLIGPVQAHKLMSEGAGVVRVIPLTPPEHVNFTLFDACMRTLHKLPYFGSKKFINWEMTPV